MQNQIIILVVMGAAFYLLLLRPQQQQAKKQATMMASLEPGARIVTIGGIYATIVSIDDDRVRIEVADGSQLEIIKRAVGSVLPDDDEDLDDGSADEDTARADASEVADDSDVEAPALDSGFATNRAADADPQETSPDA